MNVMTTLKSCQLWDPARRIASELLRDLRPRQSLPDIRIGGCIHLRWPGQSVLCRGFCPERQGWPEARL